MQDDGHDDVRDYYDCACDDDGDVDAEGAQVLPAFPAVLGVELWKERSRGPGAVPRGVAHYCI